MRHIWIVWLFVSFSTFSQTNSDPRMGKLLSKLPDQKDSPQQRAAFDRLKTQDPVTGTLPDRIREKELLFFKSQLQAGANGRVASDGNLINWVNRGPYNVGGRTRALAIDLTNEDVILAGGVSGGLWRSTNGGQSWQKVTGSNDLQSITGIAQDPRAGHRHKWYYITGEYTGNSASATGAPYRGDGVYRSTDGGLTWQPLTATVSGTPQSFDSCFDYSHEVAVSPANGNVFVANACGIFRSTDMGDSWTEVYDATDGWTEVAIDPAGVVYAYVNDKGVIRSTNSGATWTVISTASMPSFASDHRGELAISSSNPNVVYLLARVSGTAVGHALWRYNASNNTWVNRTSGIPRLGGHTGDFDSQGGYNLLIKVKPDNENFVVIGGTNLFRSTDGFATTTNTSWIGGYTPANNSYALYSNHHPDQHCMVFYPSNPNRALSGNDGGVQRVEDVRVTNAGQEPLLWAPLNNGYLTSQVYAVSIGPENQILAGFQDNGTWFTNNTNSTENWVSPFGGDGAYSAFSNDGRNRWVSAQNAVIYRFTYPNSNSTSSTGFTEFDPANDYNSQLFITPFQLDPVNNQLFYLGGVSSLFVNTQAITGNTTAGWKSVTLTGSSGVVSAFGAIGNGSVYVGTSLGRVFKVTNASATTPQVTDISPSATAGRYISGIGVDEKDPNRIIICVSNYNVPSIYFTENGGTTWTDVSGNLEENPNGQGSGPSVRTVSILGDGLFIAGTSVGLFTTDQLNGTETVWMQENVSGLGAVVVEHVVTRNTDGLVIAGTHGNGVFSAIKPVSAIDLAVQSIDEPSTGLLGVESVMASVINFGSQTVEAYTLTYLVGGIEQETVNISQPLATGERSTHTFTQTFDFSETGDYEIEVRVQVANDEVATNNSLIESITSLDLVSSFPYSESFETDAHKWQLDGIWERGHPAQTHLSAPSSGSSALMTDLNANYRNESLEWLISPLFDFRDVLNPVVSFDINYRIEAEWDAAVFGYRTGPTGPFNIITNDRAIANWYDGTANVLGQPAWNGSSNGWKQASADLSFLAGQPQVQFAFLLSSDESVNDEGLALDHFQITVGQSNILLSSNEILEANEIGAVVGALSLSDQREAVFSFATGSGDADNASFTIANNELRAAEVFDFESKATYSIRLHAQPVSGSPIEQEFQVFVEKVNAVEIGEIQLSSITLEEENAVGVQVGELSISGDAEVTFSLVAGTGSSGNGAFIIEEDRLLAAQAFDFAEQSSYSIRVRAQDATGGLSAEQRFVITITQKPELGSIVLSTLSIPENNETDASVATLVTENGHESTFRLVAGSGATDNARFAVEGNQLVALESFDYETISFYQIRLRAVAVDFADSTEQAFDLEILDVNENPFNLSLSNTQIPSNQQSGDVIGTFSAEDPEGDEVAFSLVVGAGDEHNEQFNISGINLQTNGLSISSLSSEFRILVAGTDGAGGFTINPFTLTVKEVLGLVGLAGRGISFFPNPVSDFLHLKLNNSYLGHLVVRVHALDGREVFAQAIHKTDILFKSTLSLAHLPDGIYTIRFEWDGNHAEGKLVKVTH